MMTTISQANAKTAIQLASQDVRAKPEQERFAAMELSCEQAKKFLALCHDVRECRVSVAAVPAKVAEIMAIPYSA